MDSSLSKRSRSGGGIVGYVPKGSGASVVHRALAEHVPAYSLHEYDPHWEYIPWAMPLIRPRGKADLIHTTPDHGALLRRKFVPLVITFHGFFLDAPIGRYSTLLQRAHYSTDLRWLTKAALERATSVVAVSKFVANMVRDELEYDGKIHIIYNGVDTSKFFPGDRPRRPEREVRVLFSGNLSRRKGADFLPRIAGLLSSDIKIWYTRGLRSQDTLPSLPNLKDIGTVPHSDMPKLYRSVDMVLIPSVREGFSLAAAEAMASGLPVIATDGSALPELIVPGKGGFLCPLGDVHQFAKMIKILSSSLELRLEMGSFNKKLVEGKFKVQMMVGNYRRLFDEVIGSKT